MVVAAVQVPSGVAESREECDKGTPSEPQRGDCTLLPMINYLEKRELPDDDNQAHELVLSRPLYTVTNRVLYRVLPDKTLRVVPPVKDHRKLFMEAYEGVFGAHLREAKICHQIQKHYWWPGMTVDIRTWCRACLVCASRSMGWPERPPLTPILVSGPFDRIGADVLKLP